MLLLLWWQVCPYRYKALSQPPITMRIAAGSYRYEDLSQPLVTEICRCVPTGAFLSHAPITMMAGVPCRCKTLSQPPITIRIVGVSITMNIVGCPCNEARLGVYVQVEDPIPTYHHYCCRCAPARCKTLPSPPTNGMIVAPKTGHGATGS